MNKPTKEIAILIVEDVESDAQLIVRLLRRAGYELVSEQVDSAEQMRAALGKRSWDFIISDYSLPQFDGLAALTLLKETGQDVPFIIVSGTMGEETAVAMMKAGAQDYLMKGDLARLVPAVERELEQAEVRRERKKAQEQLLLQSYALNAAANAIVITDRAGVIEWVNPAFAALTLYSLEEAIGKNPRELVKSGRHDPLFYREMWNTILTGNVWRGELINRRKDGSLYPEEMTITPLKNADGMISHFIAVKQDVSERSQMEELLRESEEKHRTFIEQSSECISLVNEQGNIIEWNHAREMLTGLKSEDVLGKPYWDIRLQLSPPDMRTADVLQRFKSSTLEMLSGQSQFLNHTYTGKLVVMNGEIKDIEQVAFSIKTKKGYRIGSVMRDITERRQAEKALADSESELRALFASMRDVVLVIDRQGVYRKIAPTNQSLLVKPSAELLGRNLRDVFPAEQAEFFIATIQQVLETSQTTQIEYELLIGDQIVWFETSISPMDNDSTLWVARDITERRQAEEALRASTTKLETLIQVSPLAIALLDVDGNVIVWNLAAERIFGWTAQEIIGHPNPIVPATRQDEYDTWSNRIFQGDSLSNQEAIRLRKDGTLINVSISSAAIYDAAGNVAGRMAIIADITERKQAEEALREREEKFRTLFNNSEVGMFRTRLDGSEILEFNEKYLKILDYTLEDLKDVPSANLWADKRERDRMVQLLNAEGHLADFECDMLNRQGEIKKCVMSVRLYRDTGILEGSIQDITERKQAEEALAASEAKLRALVEQMPAIVYTESAETRETLYISPQVEKLTGCTPAEWIENYDLWKNIIHPEDQAAVVEENDRTSLTHDPFSVEYRILTRDGRTVWLHDEAVMIQNQDGTPLFWQGVMYDITERKQAQEYLRASEERHRTIIQTAMDGFWVADKQGRLLEVNETYCRMSGYSEQELLTMHISDLEYAEMADDVIAHNKKIMMQGEDRFESSHRRKDGSIFHVEVRVQYRPIDGGRLVAFLKDITERKQIEDAMRTTNTLLEQTLEQSPIPMVLVSMPDGIVRSANSACRHFLGIDDEPSPVGTSLFSLNPSWQDFDLQGNPGVLEELPLARSLTGLSTEPQERRIVRKDGTSVYELVYGSPIFDSDGRVIAGYLVIMDITERKHAEDLLREQSEQLRLLYEASQRLNRSLDLHEIYQSICDFMSTIAPNDGVIISAFDSEMQLITCRAYWMEGKWLDVSPFPSIPLEAEGKGTQSIAIRTGQSLLLNDYQAWMKTARNTYYVNNETNEIITELPPEEEDITRSALVVPLKVGDRVSGVIQVLSYRPNAYTENQLKLLEALALHIVSAEQNALLYARVQTELNERKQAEKSLREREEQYRTLVEQLPAIVYIDDGNVEGRTLYISPQIKTILGFTPQEWQESSPGLWSTQIHPDDLEWVHAEYMRCFLHGEPYDMEYRISASDGRMLWFRDQAVRLSDENGKPHLIHGVIYDITERKQAEESLQISEARYRGLFNSMIDGFALHEIICDTDGKPVDYRFLELNPAFERLTGLQAENLIGRTVLEVMPNTEPYWIEMYGNVALTDRSAFFENYSGELNRHFEVSAYCPRYGQFAVIMVDITERKRAEAAIHRRVIELEMLYQSGLMLSQLLNPKEIGQKILELLEEKLDWHHTRIRLYHSQDDSLELLDFNQPGLKNEKERREVVDRFQSLITSSSQGICGWVVQHGQPVRCDEVRNDPRYVEAYPGIHSGLYVPMKLGERIVGVISIEDEREDAFSEADERLIVTLANQAASAFENARLFEETRQRVTELETLNRISLVLRAVTKQNEMLSIVLDEALAILNTSHGSIELHNKLTNSLDQTILRGWIAQVTAPHPIEEGIAGRVFTSGEIYISREFAGDPATRPAARSQIPPGWGGICLPIRTTQQTLGVMIVSMPSERKLNKDEIRLLSILSEMTGAALQRMQLHEQTVHRLEQLNSLRAVDQAISSSRDMNLTLNILLTHTISQLKMDAADVLLLQPGSNQLNLAAGRGFRALQFESISMSESFAGRAILEHRPLMQLGLESAALREYPQFAKLWKEEGFTRYWCVPLIVKGEVKGALEVYSCRDFSPDSEWIEFLEAFAGQAAIAIDSTQLFENLQRANMDLSLAYDATIEGWSRAMDLRDHETEGHTLRVTELTEQLARAMHVSESQLTAIRRGALLHDIGKMGVPDAILLKEGALTDEEWLVMRRHPHLAREMLMPIAYLNDALVIPYCHHEKWDGSGYPQGLKGDHIPLSARIFAVVDVWDAITNNRTYRKKWTKKKARQYIREQSGIHFDPHVVDVFLKNMEKE